ncbi:hypothetical protein EV13_2339 [Prochlorococcus sp. MIT 0702]|nr:hypothetical protein EV12_1941 [Prochlorococcus sp. MIT 0701]KGG26878.1 hypothetical protein EV13_2339 [Prochlorococcus sp. MIT 0702]KGG36154.1 hypothetical protein EV14_0563 [Prochlorococcus sp. MIT 0703]
MTLLPHAVLADVIQQCRHDRLGVETADGDRMELCSQAQQLCPQKSVLFTGEKFWRLPAHILLRRFNL